MRTCFAVPAFCLLVLCGALSGCSSIQYDIDLFSDDGWVSRDGDTYTYVRRSLELSADTLQVTFSGFSGKNSVWKITSTVHTTLDMDISIAPGLVGLYRICLISPDKRVTTLASGPGTVRTAIPVAPGRQYIALVGHEASGTTVVHLSSPAVPEACMIQEIP